MAIRLNTAYSKKLGLPGYSSHSFSASVEVELGDINDVHTECARLYGLLQASVDGEIRNAGYVPAAPGEARSGTRRPAPRRAAPPRDGAPPPCSERQRELIVKVARENKLPPAELEALAREHGGAALADLDKAGASRLIDTLFERFGGGRKAA